MADRGAGGAPVGEALPGGDLPQPLEPSGAFDRDRMIEEIRAGLRRSRKELPPKFFYDDRGSLLFDQITRLPEYYLTRAERSLLEDHARELIADLKPRSLMELGAGSADKSRILLDAMVAEGTARAYVPVDVSARFLHGVAADLRDEYPDLEILPYVADLMGDIQLECDLPRPTLFAFLGSTIGNFEAHRAEGLLRKVALAMTDVDFLLLGVDLIKDPTILEAAYNDAGGVTAEFNRNVLRVLNVRLGADFDRGSFGHRAFYDAERRRIEMHLVSILKQRVTIPGVGEVLFERGETIHTESSHKYDRAMVAAMLDSAGLSLRRWLTAPDQLFALAVAARA